MYRGRFAPSPTGPLHFGSLVAATGSYLQARKNGGEWMVRIEDVDTPRNVPGAADHILRTLDQYGFQWNGPVLHQSTRFTAYEQALETLRAKALLFPCCCSRKEVGEVYPGTCRHGLPPDREVRSWRLRVNNQPIEFTDQRTGQHSEVLTSTVGDFVLKRADGLFTYQLAVVVDDAFQGITDVVRGADLLTSTCRQIYLQRALQLPTPSYLHLPVVVDPRGDKLSKQTKALPIPSGELEAADTLAKAFAFLGHIPIHTFANVREAWRWILNA